MYINAPKPYPYIMMSDFHLAMAAVPSVASTCKDIKAAQPANIQDWQWLVVVMAHASPTCGC